MQRAWHLHWFVVSFVRSVSRKSLVIHRDSKNPGTETRNWTREQRLKKSEKTETENGIPDPGGTLEINYLIQKGDEPWTSLFVPANLWYFSPFFTALQYLLLPYSTATKGEGGSTQLLWIEWSAKMVYRFHAQTKNFAHVRKKSRIYLNSDFT